MDLKESNRKEKHEIKEDDDESIGKVFDAIGLDQSKIVKHYRLKSKESTKPGPLVLEIVESTY